MKLEYKILLLTILLIASLAILIQYDNQEKSQFLHKINKIPEPSPIIPESPPTKDPQLLENSPSILYPRYQPIESPVCSLPSIGHKLEADQKLFTLLLGAKDCLTIAQGTYQVSDSKITASCPYKKTPKIYFSKEIVEKLGKFELNFAVVEDQVAEFDSSQNEFFAVDCGGRGKGQMVLKGNFNESIEKKTREVQGRNKKEDDVEQLTVVLLVIDSASRQSFFRNLVKVSKYFNEKFRKVNEDYAVYDFVFNHAIHSKTLSNLIPILTGQHYKTLLSQVQNLTMDNPSHFSSFKSNEQKSLWNYFKSKGFTTLFSYDTVYDYLSTVFGRQISADHILSNFWHLSEKVFQYSDFSERIQCIGDKYPHDYSFSYIQDFIDNYPKSNKFIYSHLSVAHEKSGKRLKIMDESLLNFIQSTLDKHKSSNLAFFLISDHGRPGGSPVMADSRAEVILPFNFLIASQSIIKKLKAHQQLKSNTKKLTSRFDLYKTLKFLSHFPYENYQNLKKTSQNIETELPAYNLFLDDINERRTCEDVGVPEEFCFCHEWKNVDLADWKKDLALDYIVKSGLDYVNRKRNNDKNCEMLKLEQIVYIKKFSFNAKDEFQPVHYDIELKTNFNGVMKLKGSRASAEMYEDLNKEYYLDMNYRFQYKSNDGRVTFMIAKVWQVEDNSICIKQEITDYKLVSSKLAPSTTCFQTCKDLDLLCRSPDFSSDFLKELAKLGQVYNTGLKASIQKHGNLLLITSGDHCTSVISNKINICNCVKNQ